MTISFHIPIDSDILIQKGHQVDFTTPLYRIGQTQTVEVDLATKLSTNPKNIFQHLKKFVGEGVQKGDLIAQSSSFLSSKSYFSEHAGIIKEIDHTRGILLMEITTAQENTIGCYFKGEIEDIDRNTIKLKVKHAKQYEVTQATDFFGGPAIYSRDPEKGSLSEEDVSDKVVIDDNIPSYEQAKYNALGAVGFVFFRTLSDYSKAPSARLKNEDDYKTIAVNKLPYCIIDKGTNTIYFYDN